MTNNFKLGKLPRKIDTRTIQFKKILRKKLLPPLPTEYDIDVVLGNLIDTNMFANDKFGDCVISARAHMTLRFEFEAPDFALIPITDDDCLNEYWSEQGDGSHPDNGLVMLDSLNAWRKGWKAAGQTYNIYAFASVDSKNHEQVQYCIFLLEGAYIGFEVPQSAMDQFDAGQIWDVVPDDGGILGGHCFCNGTIVITNKGLKFIENIENGDMVLTHDGTYQKVINVIKHEIDEEIFKIITNLDEDIYVTKEHPFYAKHYSKRTHLTQTQKTKKNMLGKKINWIKIDDLKEGDLIYCPIDDSEMIDSGVIYEKKFFKLLGLYIGDGNIAIRYSKNGNIKSARLRFTLGDDYPELIEECISILHIYSNNKVNIYQTNTHSKIITCFDTKLALFIGNLCGFANNKTISNEILHAPKDLQKELIKGWYWTDGNDKPNGINIFTSERILAEQLIFILKRIRLLYKVNKVKSRDSEIRNRKVSGRGGYLFNFNNMNDELEQKRTNHRSIYQDKYLIMKFLRKEEIHYKGIVYNLEVENNHSYTANGFAVHNCVYVVAFNPTGPICVTWGKRQQMSWNFLDRYCDEAYGIVDNKDPDDPTDPLDVAKLQEYLNEITNQPTPVPPTPPSPVCPFARAVSKIPFIGWKLVKGYRKIRKYIFNIEAGTP